MIIGISFTESSRLAKASKPEKQLVCLGTNAVITRRKAVSQNGNRDCTRASKALAVKSLRKVGRMPDSLYKQYSD